MNKTLAVIFILIIVLISFVVGYQLFRPTRKIDLCRVQLEIIHSIFEKYNESRKGAIDINEFIRYLAEENAQHKLGLHIAHGNIIDPWGHIFEIKTQKMGNSAYFISPGEDGVMHTADDIQKGYIIE